MTRAGQFLASALLLGACGSDAERFDVPDAQTGAFLESAYPVLLADCGFPACHGDSRRFFQVYGPGRTRLAPDTDVYDPPTPEEVALSYTLARSMLVAEEGVRRAPLLRKPLAVRVGGSGHLGDDPWGGAIYASKRAPGYEALFFWAISGQKAEDE